MSLSAVVGNILASKSIKPIVTQEDVKNILLEDYGLTIKGIKNLNGYDDKNFLVNVEKFSQNEYIHNISENGYVLKIVNTLDSKEIEFFNAQDCALVYLGNRKICCPKPVKTKKGQYLILKNFISGDHVVRLLEYISASILVQVECSRLLCYECGEFIANLSETMKDFKHKGFEDRTTLWMLGNVPKLHEFLFAVKDAGRQQLVTEVIEAFSSRVMSKINQFEKRFVHGDFNEQNILVGQTNGQWHVSGVLDFGDSHIGCYLFDLAITMTYIIFHSKDIESGGYVLAGYNAKTPLKSQDIQLLKICVCARMCQSLVLGAFTYSREPENTYVICNAIFGWTMLQKLWAIPDDEITNRWLNICHTYVPK